MVSLITCIVDSLGGWGHAELIEARETNPDRFRWLVLKKPSLAGTIIATYNAAFTAVMLKTFQKLVQ